MVLCKERVNMRAWSFVYDWKTSIWGMWEEHNNCFLNLEAK